MSARWDARSAERNEGQLERVSSARARVLTMTFSSFGSIARRVGRRALYRWHRRAARAAVSRPRRKTAADDGLDEKSAADTLLTRRGLRVRPASFSRPLRSIGPRRTKSSWTKLMTANAYVSRETGFFFLPRGVASWQHHTLPLVASARGIRRFDPAGSDVTAPPRHHFAGRRPPVVCVAHSREQTRRVSAPDDRVSRLVSTARPIARPSEEAIVRRRSRWRPSKISPCDSAPTTPTPSTWRCT